jgi:PLD-like domain
MHVHFSLLAQQLIQHIEKATQHIHIAVCWFTLPELLEALLKAQQKGVQVSFILNFDQLNFGVGGLPLGRLLQAGAKGFGYTGLGLLHHKFMVIDGLHVWTGSYNWTRSQHHDSLLQVEDVAMASDFLQEWQRTRQLSSPLETLNACDARPISIAHLFQPSFWKYTDLRRNLLRGARIWLAQMPISPKEKAITWQSNFQRHLWCVPQCKTICQKAVQSTGGWERNTILQYAEDHAEEHHLPIRGNAFAQAKLFSKKLNESDLVLALEKNQVLALGVVMSKPLFDEQKGLHCAVEWQLFPSPLSLARPIFPIKGFKRLNDGGLALLDELLGEKNR